MVVALIAAAAGSTIAVTSYRDSAAPSRVVAAYFAALSRSDAPAALAVSELPTDGSRRWLTDTVLAAQNHVAPLVDAHIGTVTTHGNHATAQYSYVLKFANGSRTVNGAVALTRTSAGWRLAPGVASTSLQMDGADDRLAFAGADLPDGSVLLFPGALPITLDTPYLEADSSTDSVGLDAAAITPIRLVPTAAARNALLTALTARVRSCVRGGELAPSCPLPNSGTVPGSLHGRVVGTPKVRFALRSDSAGTIVLIGTATFRGTYRLLDFDNEAHARSGDLHIPLDAIAYPVAPLALQFETLP